MIFPVRQYLFTEFLLRFHYGCDVSRQWLTACKNLFFILCCVFLHDTEVILPKMKLFFQWVSSLDESLQISLSGEESA